LTTSHAFPARSRPCYILAAYLLVMLIHGRFEAAGLANDVNGDMSVALLREYEHGKNHLYRQRCNSRKKSDGASDFVCAYLKYKETGNGRDFINSIPKEPNAITSLWHIDENLSRGMGPQYSGPKFLHDGSFSFSFVDAVYKQVQKQNPKALDRFLALNASADGAVAEYTADLILDAFDHNAMFILTHWNVAKPYVSTIGLESTDLSDRKSTLKKKYQRLCKRSDVPREACVGAANLLGIGHR